MSTKPAALASVVLAIILVAVLGRVEAEFWVGIAVVLLPSLSVLAYLLWVAEDER